jgi:hypothetical protein
MSDELEKRRASAPAMLDGSWGREAAGVRGPFAGFAFGLRARANMRALQVAGEHANAVGALMDIAVTTMDKMQRAQDRAREFAVRDAHHIELAVADADRLFDALAEDRHRREIAAKRRLREQIDADTDILAAQQAQRAKKKFERLKHQLGEERFKTEAARRKVGAAEAAMAADEALKGHAPEPEKPAEPERKQPSRAAVISSLLEGVRARLREMRADDEDSDARKQLVADEASLERILAKLLKAGED